MRFKNDKTNMEFDFIIDKDTMYLKTFIGKGFPKDEVNSFIGVLLFYLGYTDKSFYMNDMHIVGDNLKYILYSKYNDYKGKTIKHNKSSINLDEGIYLPELMYISIRAQFPKTTNSKIRDIVIQTERDLFLKELIE